MRVARSWSARRWRVAGAAVASAVVAVALATGSAAGAVAPAGGSTGAAMPLDQYMVPDAQVAALETARTELGVACLRSLGISPDGSAAAVQSTASYPVFSPLSSQAATAGYATLATPHIGTVGYVAGYDSRLTQPDPSEAAAMYGTVATVHGHQVPAGGCRKEAQRELEAGVGALPADPRGAQLRTQLEALRDPRMAAVFKSWSACMAQHGYHYGNPMDAAQDSRWANNSVAGTTYQAATPAQTDTATTDAACQASTNLPATWDTLNRDYQNQIIAAYGTQLAQANTIVSGWLANANRLGATTPVSSPAAVSPAVTVPVNGPYTYQNNATGLFLDSHGATCNNGAPIDGWPLRDGATNERWYISEPLLGNGRILADQQCLASPGGSQVIEDNDYSTANVLVDQWALVFNGTYPQDNELTDIYASYYGPPGYYNLVNDYSGHCVTEQIGATQGQTLIWLDAQLYLTCAGGAAPEPSDWR